MTGITKRVVRLATVMTILLALVVYAYYQSRTLITGPSVSILAPANGSAVEHSLINIKGVAQYISYISLNDRQIFVDEEGNFSEQLLLSYGYNIIEVTVRDRFGREKLETLELVYK